MTMVRTGWVSGKTLDGMSASSGCSPPAPSTVLHFWAAADFDFCMIVLGIVLDNIVLGIVVMSCNGSVIKTPFLSTTGRGLRLKCYKME